MRVVGSFAEARPGEGGLTGLVPTMGFLHEGHLSLIGAARNECDTVVMSLYVNALQFGELADLDEYPRDVDRDLALAEAAGVDVVFLPDDATMYPAGEATRVSLPALSRTMEGRFRPGHFEGVATVVAKLFAGVGPDVAYFGRKDAQQLALVTRMAADLRFPLSVKGLPIVREADGLALSSRNVRLRPEDRAAALALSAGLFSAADLAEEGEEAAGPLVKAVTAELEGSPALQVEYVTLASQADASVLDGLDRPAFLAVAARVGDVRLIDNIHLFPGTGGVQADRGVVIEGTSVLYRAGEAAAVRPITKGDIHAAGDRHR